MRSLSLRRPETVALYVFFLVLALRPAHGQEANSVTITPKWRKGETAEYKLTRTRAMPGNAEEAAVLTTTLNVEVIEPDLDKGLALAFTIGEMTSPDPRLEKQLRDNQRAVNPFKNLTIRMKWNSDQTDLTIENWGDLKESAVESLEGQLKVMEAGGLASQTIATARQSLEPILENPGLYVMTYAPELIALFEPQGLTLTQGKPESVGTHTSNILGGPSVPAVLRRELRSYEPSRNRIVYDVRKELDAERTREALKITYAEQSKRIGKPISDDDLTIAVGQMDISDVTIFVVDTSTGWPEMVENVATATSGAEQAMKSWTLTRKK